MVGGTDFVRHLILTSLDDDKAEDVSVVELAGKTSFADAMVVATGRSARHVSAIADHIVEKLRQSGHEHVHVEGKEQCNWVLIDAGDIVVHVFKPDVREMYNLEKMWAVAVPERSNELAV